METPDQFAISVAKTEYREGFNTGDVERVLSVFAPGFMDMSDGQPSVGGPAAREALRARLTELFGRYTVRVEMMIIDVIVSGDTASDFGWHKLWLTPRNGGDTLFVKQRYFERWNKSPDGAWKISFIITNKEGPLRMEPFPESEVMTAGTVKA